jgi:phosphoglycolate phosphatase-like HAD superfamily hydrolase
MTAVVIFDFDGIIVDTEPLHYRAFQEILIPWSFYAAAFSALAPPSSFRGTIGRRFHAGRRSEPVHGFAAAGVRSAGSSGRVALGRCLPRAPTGPDLRN